MRRGREEADTEPSAAGSSPAQVAAEPPGDGATALAARPPAEAPHTRDLSTPWPAPSGIAADREWMRSEQRPPRDVQAKDKALEQYGAFSSRSSSELWSGRGLDLQPTTHSPFAEPERAVVGRRSPWERQATEQTLGPFRDATSQALEQALLCRSPMGSQNGFHDTDSLSEVRSVLSGAGASERPDLPVRKQGSGIEVGRLGHADLIARARAVQRETTEAIERAKANAERKSWDPSETSWRGGRVAERAGAGGQEASAPLQLTSLMSVAHADMQKIDRSIGGFGAANDAEPWCPSPLRSVANLAPHDTRSGVRREELSGREAWISPPVASPAKPVQFDVHWEDRRQEGRGEGFGQEAWPTSALRLGSPFRPPSPSRSAITTRLTPDGAPQRQRGWSPQPTRMLPLSPQPSLAYPPSPEEEQSHRSTLDLERQGCHPRGQGSPGGAGHVVFGNWRISSSSSLEDPSGIVQGSRDSVTSRLRKSPSESWSLYAPIGSTARAPSRVDEELRSSLSSQGSFFDAGSVRAGVDLGGRRQPQLNRSVSFEEPSSSSEARVGLAAPNRHANPAGDAVPLAGVSPRPVCDRAGLSPRPFDRAGSSLGLGDRFAQSPRPFERSTPSITPLTSTLWKPSFRPSQALLDSHRPRVLRDSHYGIGVR